MARNDSPMATQGAVWDSLDGTTTRCDGSVGTQKDMVVRVRMVVGLGVTPAQVRDGAVNKNQDY